MLRMAHSTMPSRHINCPIIHSKNENPILRYETMLDLQLLEPRQEPKRLGRFHRGAHKPLAIRWFGMTALAGHLRHLLAVAAASNQLDLRDCMRPEDPAGLLERGAGMADNTIATGLCPSGRLRMERSLRVLKTNRVDPTAMTSHAFGFDEMERAFEVAEKKLDDVVKALITF